MENNGNAIKQYPYNFVSLGDNVIDKGKRKCKTKSIRA